MWLVDTSKFELREFLSTPPPYAILSHTWGDEEVSFQELKEVSSRPSETSNTKNKAGYHKIIKCCDQARTDGLAYIWVDTCCIDKRSSSELSEAINSMFRWYSEALLCYAHLADVSILHEDKVLSAKSTSSCPRVVWGLPSSRYFTRGWTFQEILAPNHVIFFDARWIEIGTKASLLEDLVEITGIPNRALMQPVSIGDYSVADRMSWAANRETTRLEDQAYCLMGLFGINMPLLYGEGKKAFYRLQLQILSESNDHSIFVWKAPNHDRSESLDGRGVSVLAESPNAFSSDDSRSLAVLRSPYAAPQTPITVTNMGLSVVLPVKALGTTLVALLNCTSGEERIAIRVTGGLNENTRSRFRPHEILFLDADQIRSTPIKSFHLLTKVAEPPPRPGHVEIQLSLEFESADHGWHAMDIDHNFRWDSCKRWNFYSLGTPSRRIVKDFVRPPGGWSCVTLASVDREHFRLVIGTHASRVWHHCFAGREGSQELMNLESRTIYPGDAPPWDETPWKYFRDRVSYRLDSSHIFHVSTRPLRKFPEPAYLIQVVEENIPDAKEDVAGE